MDPHSAAVGSLVPLFDDGGAALLSAGGLGDDWDQALQHVPAEILDVPEGPDAGQWVLLRLRDFWVRRGDLRPALAATRALHRIRHAAGGAGHPDTLVEQASLGSLIERAGHPEDGVEMLEGALRGLASVLAPDDPRWIAVTSKVALSRVRRGALAEAEPLLAAVWRAQPLDHPKRGMAGAQLAEVRVRLGRHADALACLQPAYQDAVAHDGPASPRALQRGRLLGRIHVELGNFAQAVGILRPVLAELPPGGDRAAVQVDLGVALVHVSAEEEGLRLVEAALRWTRDHDRGGDVLPGRLATAAHLRMRRGQLAEAEGLMVEALEIEGRLHGTDSPQVAMRQASLGRLCARQGRLDEALGWLEPAASLLRGTVGDADGRTRAVVEAYGTLLAERARAAWDAGDRPLGDDLVARGLEVVGAVLGRDHRCARGLRGVGDGRRR